MNNIVFLLCFPVSPHLSLHFMYIKDTREKSSIIFSFFTVKYRFQQKIVYLSIQLSFNVLVHTGLHAISGVYRNDSSVSARKWDERQTNIFERFIFASCESFCYSFPIEKVWIATILFVHSVNMFTLTSPMSIFVWPWVDIRVSGGPSHATYSRFSLCQNKYYLISWLHVTLNAHNSIRISRTCWFFPETRIDVLKLRKSSINHFDSQLILTLANNVHWLHVAL